MALAMPTFLYSLALFSLVPTISATPHLLNNPHDRSSSHQQRAATPVLPSGWSYTNCYADSTSARVLSTMIWSSSSNTQDKCVAGCNSRGYVYAGVQYGKECWCGNVLNNPKTTTSCSTTCPGDSKQKCGAGNKIGVFTKSTAGVSTSGWKSLGCYVDQADRTLNGPSYTNTGMTPAYCQSKCSAGGYSLAGVENGKQCWCSNSLSKKTKSSGCTTKCGGNSSLVCGGSWALNVYQKAGSTTTTTTTKTTTTKTTTTTTKSAATTTPPASSNGSWYRTNGSNSGKLVIAHVIFGNCYSYTSKQWIEEIKMASAQGIDGFALNFGYDYWQADQMQSAYDAATASGTGFKMFFSLDMSVLRCDDDDTIRFYINKFKNHPAQLKDASGNMWITTFDGGSCKSDAQWNNVLRTNGVGIKFVPGFFNDLTYTKMKQYYPSINGDFWWGPAWPKYNNVIDWSEDGYRIERGGLNRPTDVYMTSVAPAFYVHYDGRNRVLRSDDHLYARRWEDLVSHRNVVDALQIVTWNDYGESTYIGPIRQDMPTGTTWVPGFDHTPFLEMTGYYASAFKTGQYPTITSDKIFFWARPHSKYATATNDGIGKPVNWDWTDDLLWVVLFSTGSGSLKVTMGSSSQTYSVSAGVNKFTLPLAQASSVTTILTRNGAQVFNFQSDAVTYTSGNPSKYNWNYAAAAGP